MKALRLDNRVKHNSGLDKWSVTKNKVSFSEILRLVLQLYLQRRRFIVQFTPWCQLWHASRAKIFQAFSLRLLFSVVVQRSNSKSRGREKAWERGYHLYTTAELCSARNEWTCAAAYARKSSCRHAIKMATVQCIKKTTYVARRPLPDPGQALKVSSPMTSSHGYRDWRSQYWLYLCWEYEDARLVIVAILQRTYRLLHLKCSLISKNVV